MGTNMQDIQFLSTLSLRRATLLFWGEQYGGKISIHALLAESDHVNPAQRAVMAAFLSTLSLRRATVVQRNVPLGLLISIHALLAESDPADRILSGS